MFVSLGRGADQAGFRDAVRGLVFNRVEPDKITWSAGDASLFDQPSMLAPGPAVSLPKAGTELVRLAVCHRDPERYALLYNLIWRLLNGERDLLSIGSDPLVHRLELMAKSVRRDLHKMHAFVRFRRQTTAEGIRFVAWFEPDHFILDEVASFFTTRFASLAWSILTPDGSLHWEGCELSKGPPGQKRDVPDADEFEAGWADYYSNTFNPGRLNIPAMQKEMPKKYWRNMPETALIPALVQNASSRVAGMMAHTETSAKRQPAKALSKMLDPRIKSLAELNEVIAQSEPLVPGATQAVLGEGPLRPQLAFVGEQPGDQEDLQGRPFVGPAGQLLMAAMQEAGLSREDVYLTNAVKHFKYEQRGKRRLHQKPTAGEVKHYRWWLMEELEFVKPTVVVALGATALLALANKPLSVNKSRGPLEFEMAHGFATFHPSYLLRVTEAAERKALYEGFVSDLKQARELAQRFSGSRTQA